MATSYKTLFVVRKKYVDGEFTLYTQPIKCVTSFNNPRYSHTENEAYRQYISELETKIKLAKSLIV